MDRPNPAVTVNEPVLLRPVERSTTCKVMVEVPATAGVISTVGMAAVPPTTTSALGTTVKLLDVAVNVQASPPVPLTVTVSAPVLPGKTTVWLAGTEMTGKIALDTVKVADAVRPFTVSVNLRVMLAEPATAGVTVIVGATEVPPMTIPVAGTTVKLFEVAVNTSASPVAPLIFTASAPVLPGRITVKLGGAVTEGVTSALTLTVKVAEAERPVLASETVKVMTAVPAAAGVTVIVGKLCVPPTTRPEEGTTVRLLEEAVRVSGSPPAPPTVTGNAPVFSGKATD